jgi:SMI1-KNR4 cell-wall
MNRMATKAKKPGKPTAKRAAKAKKPAVKRAAKAKKPAAKRAAKAPAILEFERGTVAGSFSKAYVQSTEDMIHLRFQPDFLTFLEAHNGGIPKRRYFKMGSNQKVVDRFLSLVPHYQDDPLGAYDIGVVWSQIEGRLNDSLVPFAGLYAGDFLCFDYSGGGKPRVVFWDHERSDEDNPFTKPVANDFQQFLSMLTAE